LTPCRPLALDIPLRKGSANTQKGILRFTDELLARVNRAGATGVKLFRLARLGEPEEIARRALPLLRQLRLRHWPVWRVNGCLEM